MPKTEQLFIDYNPSLAVGSYNVDESGFIDFWTAVAAPGDLKYTLTDGSTLICRIDAAELCNKDSIDSLIGQPVTLNHEGGEVVPESAKGLIRGTVLDARWSVADECVQALVRSYDAYLTDIVVSKKTSGVSPCYWANRVPNTDGSYQQRGRTYNHLSILEGRRPRGSNAAVLLDSFDDFQPTTAENPMEELLKTLATTVEAIAVKQGSMSDSLAQLLSAKAVETKETDTEAGQKAHADSINDALAKGFEAGKQRANLEAKAKAVGATFTDEDDNMALAMAIAEAAVTFKPQLPAGDGKPPASQDSKDKAKENVLDKARKEYIARLSG